MALRMAYRSLSGEMSVWQGFRHMMRVAVPGSSSQETYFRWGPPWSNVRGTCSISMAAELLGHEATDTGLAYAPVSQAQWS